MKKLFIAFCIAVAGFGAWWLSDSKRVDWLSGIEKGMSYVSYVVPNVSSNPDSGGLAPVQDVSKKGKGAINAAENSLGRVFTVGKASLDSTKDAILDTPKKLIGKVLDAVDAAVNSGKSYLGVEDKIPSKAGIGTQGVVIVQSNEATASSPVGQVIKRGQTITFVASAELFKKNNTDILSVSINWGDGGSENKDIHSSSDTRFLSHVFQKSGEYKVFFAFGAGDEKTQYETMVLVRD